MLARDRFPHAVILAGPQGAGKYTLALMVARAMNCLQPPETDGLPDFCGVCSNCTRIGQAEDLDGRFAEAVEAREGLRETDKRETRILVQTHPDVLVVPPDPPPKTLPLPKVMSRPHLTRVETTTVGKSATERMVAPSLASYSRAVSMVCTKSS